MTNYVYYFFAVTQTISLCWLNSCGSRGQFD